MKKLYFLFLIIFIEGYVVLSAELLAIRQLIPYVGSGTDTVSIIIAAVLMPLAIGYYVGGQFKENARYSKNKSVRRKLLNNIFIAALFFFPALSFVFIGLFFEIFTAMGIDNRLLLTTIYSLVFIVTPVFLLAQTIPLVSHYFSKEKLAEITGKMLFFSTVGSFMGAVFSTLILMAFVGVHYTAVITIGLLTLLYFMLSKSTTKQTVIMTGVFIAALLLNSHKVMETFGIVENNKYNMIRIANFNDGNTRIMSLNNNRSSIYTDDVGAKEKQAFTYQTSFKYADFITNNILPPHDDTSDKKYSVLIIGAGGFTLGLDDLKNDYTYIDIDGSLKEISEKYFLKQKLSDNKKFEPIPARSFVQKAIHNNQKYDVIILDAYLGATSIPEHLVTKEFFSSMRDILKDNGIVAANFIISATYQTTFSKKIDNTLRQVFPHISRQITNDFSLWDNNKELKSNIVYIYKNNKKENDGIYTDDKNQIFYDQ